MDFWLGVLIGAIGLLIGEAVTALGWIMWGLRGETGGLGDGEAQGRERSEVDPEPGFDP